MRLASLAALGTMLIGQPVLAQNLIANHGPYYVGTLTEYGVMEHGVRRSYAAIDLVSPMDYLCDNAPPNCEPILAQTRVQLLPTDRAHERIFDRARGRPVRVFGEVYRGDTASNTPLFIGVEDIEVLPQLGVALPAGLYTRDSQHCTGRDDDYGDGFFTLAASKGSLSIHAYEMSCIAQRVEPDGDGAMVTFGCWGEGEEYDNTFRLSQISDTQVQLGHWSLNRCEAKPSLANLSQKKQTPEPPKPAASTLPTKIEPVRSGASVDHIDLRRPHADSLYYGSRVGMTATITSATGLGTRSARITVEHTAKDALDFCALYAFAPTRECLVEELGIWLVPQVTADCEAGVFTALNGAQYRTAMNGDQPDIVDMTTGAALDGSSASGYPVALATYEALCPTQTGTRRLIGAAQYDASFDALQELRGKALTAESGIAALPIMDYAFRDRPEIAPLLLARLAESRLVMSGHYGFADVEGASLLVDFARRDILACYINRTDFKRLLSYRFGTMIDGGLDGFTTGCPRNIEQALREYAPLVSPDQTLSYPGPEQEFYDGDSFGVAISPIDHFPDVLGLGKVLYHDDCVTMGEFNPGLFTHFGANWIYEGRFESEVSLCRIMESRHLDDDMIELGFICTNAGERAGFGHAGLSRPRDGWVTWDDGTMTSQCHTGFRAASRYYLGESAAAPNHMLRGTAGKLVEWSGEDAFSVYRFGEIDLTIALKVDEGYVDGATLTASRAGRPYFTIDAGAGLSGVGGLGVFPMEAGRETLVFSSFSGGASCCTELYAVPLGTINAKVISLGAYYGDVFGPKDLDGDGLYEFEQLDFGFTFLPYSASHWMAPPPLILAQRDGEFYDATGEDRFRPAVLERFAFVDELCGGSEGWYMSACVSRAATSQILGTYEDTMATLEQRMLTSPRPAGWEGPHTFPELRALLDLHLVEMGYPPAQ